MEYRELKRYVRLPSGKFIDTQKVYKGQYYDLRILDGIPNYLCLLEEGCSIGQIITLFFETSDYIFELVRDNDYVMIDDTLYRVAKNDDVIEASFDKIPYLIEGILIEGEDGQFDRFIEQVQGVFTWKDNRTLRQVWDKDEGVIEWE